MEGALLGVKVLELASYIAGPFATMLLGDLGAEVVKIEVPGKGDEFRSWGKEPKNYSPLFCGLNRNKKSLTLDVRNEKGKEIFLRLAQGADVIVENFRPGVVDRLGIGYEAVRAMNPRMIYCSVSGYGQTGPYRDRPGYDTIGQALSGLLSVLTDLASPRGPGAAFSDHLTGIYACYGILAALMVRERTGEGQKVETSLLEATIGFTGGNSTRFLATGDVPRLDSRVRTAQVYAFVAGDGLPFVIHLSSPQKFWEGLTDAVGHPELREETRFKDRQARIDHYDALENVLKETFKSHPREYWLKRLEERDVPSAPIKTLDEVFEDPQVCHLQMVRSFEHPEFGPLKLVRNGVNLSKNPLEITLLPPKLGEHTEDLIQRLGYSSQEVSRFRAQGIV